jgi:hypothetical protein
MSFVVWSALWHVVPPGARLTLCGRALPPDARCQETPPPTAFMCSVCIGREAVRPTP